MRNPADSELSACHYLRRRCQWGVYSILYLRVESITDNSSVSCSVWFVISLRHCCCYDRKIIQHSSNSGNLRQLVQAGVVAVVFDMIQCKMFSIVHHHVRVSALSWLTSKVLDLVCALVVLMAIPVIAFGCMHCQDVYTMWCCNSIILKCCQSFWNIMAL